MIMRESEITFAEFWSIVENASRIDVEEVPPTDLPWDKKRIEAYILNQERSGHSELRYFCEPFFPPVFYMEVRLNDRRVFLLKITN